MRKPLMLLAALCLGAIVIAQTPSDGARKRPQRRQVEGVRISGNKAYALPGYELTKSSNNILEVKKKKKKDQTGTLRCGCVAGGGCTLSVPSSGQAICEGQCDGGCTLYVQTGSIKPM